MRDEKKETCLMPLDRILLGEAIRRARNDRHISQEKLAEMLDISPNHMKHIESGHRGPSLEVLFHLAVILNLSLDALLFPERADGQETRAKLRRLVDALPARGLEVLLAAAEALQRTGSNPAPEGEYGE